MKNFAQDILSFDNERVTFYQNSEGKEIVEKKSSFFEYENLVSANIFLLNNPVFLLDKYRLLTVNPIRFDENSYVIQTENFCGVTLETMFRDTKTDRKFLVQLIKAYFTNTTKVGFYWGDCAPRNMILNLCCNEIRIVDFERPLIIDSKLCKNKNFHIRYFRDYSYEEFFTFLLKSEQRKFIRYTSKESSIDIEQEKIRSKRKRTFLNEFFGNKSSYSTSEIRFVEDLIVQANTPFIYKKKIFYPVIMADWLYEKLGFCTYREYLFTLNNSSKRSKYETIESHGYRFKKFSSTYFQQ